MSIVFTSLVGFLLCFVSCDFSNTEITMVFSPYFSSCLPFIHVVTNIYIQTHTNALSLLCFSPPSPPYLPSSLPPSIILLLYLSQSPLHTSGPPTPSNKTNRTRKAHEADTQSSIPFYPTLSPSLPFPLASSTCLRAC